MKLTTRRCRRLLLAGAAVALFSGLPPASAVAAAPNHTDGAPEAISLAGTEEPLPGGDSTVPGIALGVLLGSAGLAWVVRRSAPASAAVAEVSPLRQPEGAEPTSGSGSAAA